MAERTDAHIFLRLAYQAMLNAGLPADDILLRAGIALSRLEESNLSRTPSAAQLARGLNRDGVGQWRRYARQLQPLAPILVPWAGRFGYPTH